MPIDKDLSGLPRYDGTSWAPDGRPRYGQLLIERWHTDPRAVEPLPTAVEGARFRHSDAGACSRVLAYKALDIPRSNPVDASGDFIMRFGSLAHDAWQEVLQERFPGAEVEVKVGDADMAGHIDAVVTKPTDLDLADLGVPDAETPWKVAIEAKTVGGFAYKRAIGVPPASRVPRGPSYSHVIQAALNAKAVDADEAVVLYWTREAISVQMAADRNLGDYGRVCAEWTLDRPTYEAVAATEITRVKAILDLLDQGVLPARKIPDPELPLRHVITVPANGEWVSMNEEGVPDDAGLTWHCAYCGWLDICTQTPAGRTPIADVPVIVELTR